MDEAKGLFREMENLIVVPNVASYNSLIHGICKMGNLEDEFLLKEAIILDGIKPNIVTYTCLSIVC